MNKNKDKKEKREFNSKYILIGLLVLIILVSVGFTVYFIVRSNKRNNDTGLNANTVSDLFKDTVVSGINIKNNFLMNSTDMSTYNATLVYTGSSNYKVSLLEVIFTVNGEEVRGVILNDTTLSPNQQIDVSVGFDRSLVNASSVRYEVR